MSRLIAALLMAAPGAGAGATPPEPPPPGQYSSVRNIPETGDDLGVNLRIVGRGPARTVFYEDCEGACHGAVRLPATVEGDSLIFTVREDRTDEKGRPLKPFFYRVLVRTQHTRSGLRLIMTSPEADFIGREILKPVRQGGMARAP